MIDRDAAAAGWRAADYLVAGLFAIAVAGAALQRSSSLHPVIYQYEASTVTTSDTWFDADIPRTACLLTAPAARQHSVTSRHPLVSIVMYMPAAVLRAVAPAPVLTTVRRMAAIHGAIWIVTFYLLLRLMGCVRLDAVIFAVLAVASSAAVFWTAVPELHVLGSVTLLLPLCLVATAWPRTRTGDGLLSLVSSASLSITLTNWMSGLAAAFAERGWRRGLQVSFNAFVIVSVLSGLQAWWFPAGQYFLRGQGMREIVGLMDSQAPWELVLESVAVVQAFVVHSIVMPEIAVKFTGAEARQLSVQDAWLGSSGWPALVAVGLWLGLLASGARQLLRETAKRSLKLVLGTCVAGQLLLHLIIGDETFLYAIQFAPLLIAVAAFGTRSANRPLVRAAALALIVVAGVNNLQQFGQASALVDDWGRTLAARGAVFQAAAECQ